MHRHSTNLVGLIFGTAFTLAGTGLLARETTGTAVDPAWATGFGLMLLGAIALVATLARAPRRDRDQHLDDIHDHTHDHEDVELDEPVTLTSDG